MTHSGDEISAISDKRRPYQKRITLFKAHKNQAFLAVRQFKLDNRKISGYLFIAMKAYLSAAVNAKATMCMCCMCMCLPARGMSGV
jgi:hypothetical protein